MRLSVRLRAFGVYAVALVLAGCSGGGTSGSAATSSTTTSTATPAATTATAATATTTTTPAAAAPVATSQTAKETDAARLASQATFGPNPAVIDRIVSLGVSGWLDEQFAATGSSYADLASQAYPFHSCEGSSEYTVCTITRNSRLPTAMRFYANALSQPDQLRQRVALALSQIIVASNTDGIASSAGFATYHQILSDNAFGNYRDVLKKTMMTCLMGQFLNMNNSSGTSPNENYAREFLQLFTMGPNKLNMDGSLIKGSTGSAVPNYTPDDIKGIASALTGWGCQQFDGNFGDFSQYDYSKPMRSLAYAFRFAQGTKTFFGITVGGDQNGNVDAVLDAAFNNSSTAPFVSKQLIQHLVTANPSAAYVGRVAAVFANNGGNVRGDLKAVVRAILTDSEARTTSPTGDNYGKVKEPVLLLTALARATNMTSDGWALINHDGELGQSVLQASSVFNFYPPDYPLAKSAVLLSPASKLISTGSVVLRHNLIYNWTVGATTTSTDFTPTDLIKGATGAAQNWSSWESFGADLDGMIDRIDLLLTARSLSAAHKTALKNAAVAITNADAATQARRRAQTLLYLVATSPFFQVDR